MERLGTARASVYRKDMIIKPTAITFIAIALLIGIACGGSGEQSPSPEARIDTTAEGNLSSPILGVAPSLEQVRSALKLKLASEVRREGELSQLFEHAGLGGLTDSGVILLSGDEGAAVIIDLARYDGEDVATQVWEQTRRDEVESTDAPGRLLTFRQLGDRSTGRVYPPSAGNESVTTVILVQLGRVVVAVTVLSNDPDGLNQGAESIARTIADKVVDSGLSVARPTR